LEEERMTNHIRAVLASAIAASLLLAGCASDNNDTTTSSDSNGTQFSAVRMTSYDGNGDGLMAGLGLSGIQGAAPGYANPANPTPAELRRNAIYNNYVALVDKSAAGGFGVIYGPTDDTTYPGREYLAYVGEGFNRATVAVQVPDSFDPANACIVAGPSSGSRGVYGAVATTGEWALANNRVVAYTDANKGTGAHDLTRNQGYAINGELGDIDALGDEASFVVPTRDGFTARNTTADLPSQATVEAFAELYPNRYAFKQAHSQENIEKDWGTHTLHAIEFAFKVLNDYETFDVEFSADNTLVIAASVSNGGSAALRAAEQDSAGLIDAVVVGEPNINPVAPPSTVDIRFGDRISPSTAGLPAYQYFAIAELYAACASLAPANAGGLFNELRGSVQPRCDALVSAGLLTDGTYEEEGAEAWSKLEAAGYLPETGKIVTGYAGIDLFQSLVATYGNSYTRSSVVDNLCNISMANVNVGELTPSENPAPQTLFATSSGIPRTANIYLIKDDSPAGSVIQLAATSSNGTADYNLEGALCWWDLWNNDSNPLHAALMAGIDEIKGSGDLNGIPTIMVHGRSDGLIPVHHSSRPYYALNKLVEGAASKLHYYEITNAQHLDFLNQTYALVGQQYVPIDYYFKQALDLMLDHLRNGVGLPPSQVVFTTPPTTGESLSVTHVPAIAGTPGGNAITFDGRELYIPETAATN
jgi:hydroxybutyrate-dimer hydrolase